MVQQAVATGGAFLKIITPNDAGVTGAHQYGFHLARGAWRYLTPFGPIKGRNDDYPVTITWQDGLVTESIVKWYGDKTRFEYRLTRFGRDFPHRRVTDVGAVLVLIRTDEARFAAYILRMDDEIDEVVSALGVSLTKGWALYSPGRDLFDEVRESFAECLSRRFEAAASSLREFPSGDVMSKLAREALLHCLGGFTDMSADDRLVHYVDAEFSLFRAVEERLSRDLVAGPFDSIDRFLEVAGTLLQRRKSRAGRSLENHVGAILRDAGVRFEARAQIQGRPDIVIPSAAAYDDPSYPTEDLYVVAVKTTCRDRWRQVLEEGPRVRKRYLVTTQRGMSLDQMRLMHEAGLTLVVPKALQREYPPGSPLEILTIVAFLDRIRAAA